jgi:hypothetical protein
MYSKTAIGSSFALGTHGLELLDVCLKSTKKYFLRCRFTIRTRQIKKRNPSSLPLTTTNRTKPFGNSPLQYSKSLNDSQEATRCRRSKKCRCCCGAPVRLDFKAAKTSEYARGGFRIRGIRIRCPYLNSSIFLFLNSVRLGVVFAVGLPNSVFFRARAEPFWCTFYCCPPSISS